MLACLSLLPYRKVARRKEEGPRVSPSGLLKCNYVPADSSMARRPLPIATSHPRTHPPTPPHSTPRSGQHSQTIPSTLHPPVPLSNVFRRPEKGRSRNWRRYGAHRALIPAACRNPSDSSLVPSFRFISFYRWVDSARDRKSHRAPARARRIRGGGE